MDEIKEVSESPKQKKSSFLKTILMVLIPLIIGGGLVYGVAKQKPEFLGLPTGSVELQNDIDTLIAEVGSIYALPTDEKPSVAAITKDIEKLREQRFFKDAQIGDKILIYIKARKAILYRESEKKIIEVGPININQASPSASPEGSGQPQGTPIASPNPETTPQG